MNRSGLHKVAAHPPPPAEARFSVYLSENPHVRIERPYMVLDERRQRWAGPRRPGDSTPLGRRPPAFASLEEAEGWIAAQPREAR